MLNIQVDNGQLQSLDSAKVISVKSGDKIQVSVEPDSNYQVLIADNEADVVLKVTNADGTSFDVVLEGLASLYEAGDVITQLLLDINGEQMVVGNIADLLGALDATAAGGVIGQNRSLAEDNPNIDPNRSAADDSDQLRSDTGAELLGVDGEANERPSVSNVFLVENEILGVEAAGDMNIITGQLTATDPNVADTHTFSIVEGSLSVTDTNGVITLLGDSVTAVVNEDGTYTISGDFNDLSDGEIATVTFDYIATDQGGLSSIPATVSLEITGTNDIPVVEDINLNGELSASWLINASTTPQEIPQGEEGPSLSSYDINGTSIENINALFYNGPGSVTLADLPDVNPYDGSAIKYSFNVNAGETITFSWIFNDAEQPQAYTEYNDTAFVVIDGQQINVLADVDEPGFTSSGLFTYTFPDAGTHEITFGVVNDDDSSVDSNLEVTYVTGGELTGTEIAGYVEALGASAVYFETFDSEDVLGVDDTQDEDTNFFTGLLSVADDDVMNEGLHTFHVVQDEENNNIVTVAGTTVVTADDIAVDIIQNEDGTWSYTIDGDFSALAAGETATVSFQYYADDTRGFDGTDGINESSISEPKTITVTITGTNDQPIVENVVRGVDEIIYENSDQDEEDTNQDGILRNDEGDMTVSGQLSASDEDVNDTHTFAQVEESVQSDNQLIDPEDLSVVVNSDGSYSMTGDFTALAAGETATVTFQYTATDSSSGSEENNTSEPKTVSITVTGTNDQPVVEAINANDILASGTETGQEITEEGSITGLWQEGSVHYTYFTVHETTTLSINANSSDFDTYLYLLRNDGDLSVDDFITSDDDDGPGLNSYIHITLAPGEYVAAVGDYYLGLNEVISGINNENRSGDFTLTFNANHDITTHDTTMNNSIFYETHDATDIPGVDDTQEDVLTSFNSTLATATDDDVNDTHTYHKLGTETIDNELVTDFNVIVNEDGTYSVSGNFNPLAAGETATVTFYYYANDGRGFDGTDGINETSISEPKAVTLTITGTNDQPIVQNVVMGVDETIYETHDENPWDNWTHVFPFYNPDMDGGIGLNDEYKNWIQGTLTASDEDVNDTHTFALADMMPVQAPNTQIIHNVNYDTNGVLWGGRGVVDVAFTSSAINANDVSVDAILLSSDNGTDNDTEFYLVGDFDALAAGETATITFKYYATDSSDFQTPGETNTSEYKTVSITVTGTNDQPVVDNVVMGLGDDIIYETHDENPWDDWTHVFPFYNPDMDGGIGLNDEYKNWIKGTLTASDDDVNDTHTFALADMMPTQAPNTQIVQNVNYDTNGVLWGGRGTVDVAFTSSAVNASDVTIDAILLSSDNGTDNDTEFYLVGDFNALASGETATVTFKYYATDSSVSQTPGETNSSEPKFVSITVTGTNDQPVVDNVVMGVDDTIYETRDNRWYNNGEDDTQDDVTTAVFGKLTAMDDDLNDTHVFNVRDYTASDYYGHGNGGPGQHGDQGDIRFDNVEFFQKGPNNPSHNVKMMIDSTDVQVGEIDVTKLVLMNNNAQDSEVDFKLEGNFNALGVGETATVTFEYIANDKTGYGQSGDANNEPSLSEAKLVTITITGTNDQPVVTANKVYSVSEADGDLIPSVEEEVTVIREAFEVQDDDVNDTHTFSIESIYNLGEIDMAGGYELFGPVTYIDALGNISAVFVQVKLPAGVDAKDISIDSIRVDGGEFEIVGSFDALSGEINGNPADVLDIKLKYFAEDQNGLDGNDGINESSRSETHWMNIKVVGTNDVASLGGDNTGNIHEDDTWTIDGQLTITDLDAGEEAYQSVVTYDNVNSTNATALGVLIMDPVSGKWSYFLDHANNGAQIQALGDEQIVEKFIVKSVDGTEQTVTITIQGENDAPLITSVTGDDTVITENQVIDGNVTDTTVLADVDASDVDSANLTYTITSGNSEGYFEINSDGEISLTALGENEIAASHVNDRIFDLGVTVSDGTLEDTTTVTITVDDNFVNIPSVDLPASMDSGASNSDNITNVTLPTWQLANIAPDALNVIITDENSVIQAQAARSSVDGMWVISNAGAGELSFNGVNWFFTPDNVLADGVYGYNAIVVDDAGNEASKAFNITIDTTPPVIDSDDIAADINETLSSINLGEIAANELNGPVTFSVSGAGFSIDQNNNLIFNGELDYESSSTQTATVTATDVAGNSISQDVTVEVNNVTGIVSLLAGGVALQTFNCCNDEGWTGHGHADSSPHGVLGWFEDDSDTRSQTFDLDTNAGEDVSINFNLSVYGKEEYIHSGLYSGYYTGSGWEGNDTFTVTVTDSSGTTIATQEYSPDGNHTGNNYIAASVNVTVPDNGEFTVKFQSSNTEDSGAQVESWSVDNFEIVGADHQVLTFDDSSEGEIDMAALLDQGNDFEDEGGNSVTTPDSVDDIDLTSGDHILSNLSVEDFIAMTDDDNTLKIKGDSGDEINLDMSQWKVADNDAVDVGNPDAGIDADSDGYVTYTNIDPVGGAAAESLQLLIDENIDVNS